MITLRKYKESDAKRLVELADNPAVSRFLVDTFPYPYTLDDAYWWIRTGSQSGITRVVESDGVFVGSVGAEPGSGEKRKKYGVGYWIGERYWGNGIATKALTIFADELFQTTDAERLQAWVYADNTASIRVLEKAGFTKDSEIRNALSKQGKLFDEHIYSRLRS